MERKIYNPIQKDTVVFLKTSSESTGKESKTKRERFTTLRKVR